MEVFRSSADEMNRSYRRMHNLDEGAGRGGGGMMGRGGGGGRNPWSGGRPPAPYGGPGRELYGWYHFANFHLYYNTFAVLY